MKTIEIKTIRNFEARKIILIHEGKERVLKEVRLDPCPFCGGTEIINLERVRDGKVAIVCECRCIGPMRTSEEEAVNAWNDRKIKECPECGFLLLGGQWENELKKCNSCGIMLIWKPNPEPHWDRRWDMRNVTDNKGEEDE